MEATAVASDYRVSEANSVGVAEHKRSNTNCIEYKNVVYMMYNCMWISVFYLK